MPRCHSITQIIYAVCHRQAAFLYFSNQKRQVMQKRLQNPFACAKITTEGDDELKISININENISDTEIVINSGSLTPEIEKIIATLRILDRQLMADKDGESYIIDAAKIIYVESVDRKTFVYTEEDCFESKLKLYEIEEQLCQGGFLRISKSCLVQLKFIRSLKAELDRKIRLTLENGEQIIVSRQYADELKHRLGVK